MKKTTMTNPVRGWTSGWAILTMLALSGCGPADGELPPIEATAPSDDVRILEASPTLSDGSPVPVHHTETVPTSILMESTGAIGGISVDATGNIFNTNFDENVWRTAPDGTTTLLNGEFSSASGNFPLADGDLLQSDWTDHQIWRIHPDGTRTLFAEEGLNGPVGLVQRPSGDFIVANYHEPSLVRVPAEGGAAEVVLQDERIQKPNGVTIDADGNIYIADLGVGTVFKWTPEGDVIELAQLPGEGNAHNVVAGGALYVNKIWDHVIYRVDLETGAFGIVSGNGRPGYDDGPTGTATIEEPNGITTNATRDTVYFNTHRGIMGGGYGLVIIRRLVLPEGL